ncbi:unnamed protein product [Durusdinium trenchii]|uniref:Uncharacterized protein n=1 Tax=Durusdinium trenchii TaxID=1381693 RepID=A0ABP0KS11_9DINO
MALDLSRLGNRSFISQAGIAEVLQAVAETGKVPTAASKSTVKRRRDAAVDLETPYGKLLCHFDLPLEDGQVGGEPQFCCFELCGVLADESALKQAFECKGASGRMLCMMCQTTCHKRLAPSPLPPRYVLHTEHNSDNFTLSTDQSVWAIVDHLQHQAALPGLSKKKFADEEVRLGWNYCPDGARHVTVTNTCFRSTTWQCIWLCSFNDMERFGHVLSTKDATRF